MTDTRQDSPRPRRGRAIAILVIGGVLGFAALFGLIYLVLALLVAMAVPDTY